MAQDVVDGLIDLIAGGGFGAVVEILVQLGIELEEIQAVQAEPLIRESGHESGRLRVGDQAVDLRAQDGGLVQGVFFGEAEKLGVRRRAPEEVGQPGGEFEVVETAALFFCARFLQIEEAGRGQDHAQRLLQGRRQGVAGRAALGEEGDEFVDIGRLGGLAAKSTGREAADDRPGILTFADAFRGRGDRGFHRQPVAAGIDGFPLDPIDPEGGRGA